MEEGIRIHQNGVLTRRDEIIAVTINGPKQIGRGYDCSHSFIKASCSRETLAGQASIRSIQQ